MYIFIVSGEVDYEELFYSGSSGKDNTWGRGSEMDLFHPITAHLLYATFVIIVSFVLMNLLIGLAVNDIQVNSDNAYKQLLQACLLSSCHKSQLQFIFRVYGKRRS
jgi:hypothetical protein